MFQIITRTFRLISGNARLLTATCSLIFRDFPDNNRNIPANNQQFPVIFGQLSVINRQFPDNNRNIAENNRLCPQTQRPASLLRSGPPNYWAHLLLHKALAAQFGEADFHRIVERDEARIFFGGRAERAVDFERVRVGDGAEQHIAVGGAASERIEALGDGRQLVGRAKAFLKIVSSKSRAM